MLFSTAYSSAGQFRNEGSTILTRASASPSAATIQCQIGPRHPSTSPYTLLGFNVRYAPFKFLEIWGRVDNATNAKYATGGALNFNAFADPISVQRFLAPGAPIGGWGGVRVRF